jgi:hypothetical protein
MPDKLQFFRRQGFIDRALDVGFRHRFSCGLAFQGHAFDRDRPFPYLPAETLNDCVIDIPISQLQSFSRSRRTASLGGFLDFSQTFDGPLRYGASRRLAQRLSLLLCRSADAARRRRRGRCRWSFRCRRRTNAVTRPDLGALTVPTSLQPIGACGLTCACGFLAAFGGGA